MIHHYSSIYLDIYVFWDVLEDVSQKVLLSPELRVILTEDV
jgi:hypothetical protein